MADPKPRPNRRLYLETLRKMTSEDRLKKALELSQISRDLFVQGLRRRFPNLGEDEFRSLLLDRLAKCHNSNY